MQVLRTVIILVIGLLAGLFVARYLPQQAPPQATQAEPEPTAPAPARNTRLASPTVTLSGQAAGNLQSNSLATVVDDDIVIAEISDFVGAPRLVVETSSGQVVPILAVLASDERYGIAALRTAKKLNNVAILQPESGSGSLYLGRELTLLTRNNRYMAEVDSAAVQDELGAYRYTVKSDTPMNGEAAAIVEPQSRQFLGLALRGTPEAIFAGAIDTDPVTQLLNKVGLEPQRSLQGYANYYFSQTTPGRLALLRQLLASEQYLSAIRFGQDILYLDAYTQKNSGPLLQNAYIGAARQEIDKTQWRRVINLVGNAEQTVGLNDDLRLLRVEAYQAVGDLQRALDDLLAMGNSSENQVRRMIVENAMAAGQPGGQSGLSLLEQALAADPDFAPYHRLMGEALARQGDMNGALASLERALALDPAMAMELDPLLQRLRARRDSPPLTEVPIQRQRNTLYVNARVNGSTETFRFLFDTGASYTAITSETALRLGINSIFFGAPVVGLETANGRVYTTTATLDSIDVGGARVNNVEAVILESMSGVDGLLGQSFMRHFDIDINRTRGVIAFNRRLDE